MHLPPYGDKYRRTGAFFSSLKVMPSSEPDMFVQISEGGFWLSNKQWVEFVGGRSPGFTAPTMGAKWTIVCLHYTGAALLIEGEPSTNPELPVLERKAFPLAAVYLQAGDTKITGDKVFDLRNLWGSTSYSHVDIEDRNHPDSHPIEAIEGLREELDGRASEGALDNLLDSKADINGTINDVFVLNKDYVGTPSSHVGIEVERGIENNAVFRYNEALNVWEYSNDGSVFIQLTNEGPSVALPVASPTEIGGIKVGDRLNMNPTTQLLSATLQSTNDFTEYYRNKLNAIEDNASADMEPSEVKLAYEINVDTNAFTDADRTKLDGVEDGATAGDMTPVDIKTSYESNINTNVFTDLEKVKLGGLEDGATDDMTDVEIKTAYENNADTNEFNDAEKAKLGTVETNANAYVHPTTHTSVMIVQDLDHRFVSDAEKSSWNSKAATADYWSKTELIATGGASDRIDWTHIQNVPSFGSADWLSPVANIAARDAIAGPQAGQCVLVQDDGDGKSAQYAYNGSQWSKIADVDWSPMTDLQVKTAYEANANTNEFSDAEKTKLGGVESGANAYSLPIATDSVLGGVKVGTGLDVDGGGILSLNYAFDDIAHGDRGGGNLHNLVSGSEAGFISVSDKAKLNTIAINSNNYVLPVATAVTLGGVKAGRNTYMDGDEIAVETGGYGNKGVLSVKSGGNIDVDPEISEIDVYRGSDTRRGVLQVGDNLNVASGIVSVPHAQGSALGVVIAGANVNVDDGTGEISIPIASAATPGVSKVGTGLSINGSSELSVNWAVMPFSDSQHGTRGGGNLHSAATTVTGGFMSAADKLKLDGVETGASGDMSSVEIKAAYELNPDTNVFTNANLTKLSGIEDGATADMTGAEIKIAYESESETNALTDTLLTKLNGIEDNAIAYVHPTTHPSSVIDHPITTTLKVDGNRVDSYTADGSLGRPFKTLTAAIGAVSGETLISVAPGSYTEDIVIEAGMHFVCDSPEKNSICTINGDVGYSTSNTSGGADGNVASFCGIDISGSGSVDATVKFYGTNPQRFNLINCEVNSAGLQPALHMNNTGAGSIVIAEDTNFNNTGAGMSATVDHGTLSQWKTQNNSQNNAISLQLNNAAVLDSFLAFFTGQIDFNGTSGGTAVHPVINASTNDAIVMNGGSLIVTVPFSLGTGVLVDPSSTGTVVNQTVAEASKINYIPTTSGDWTGSPIEVLSALDELAARPSGGVSWNYAATADSLPPSPVTGEMWFIGSLASRAGISIPVWYDGVDWVDGVGTFVDLGAGG